MIMPEEFPYIKSLYVNDCYAYKDFNIELHDYKPFSHLILTGKNGSGKSTILNIISKEINVLCRQDQNDLDVITQRNEYYKARQKLTGNTIAQAISEETVQRQTINLSSNTTSIKILLQSNEFLYAFFEAKRDSKVTSVSTVTKQERFVEQLSQVYSTGGFAQQFKQYLVNKKVYQAFDQMDNNTESLLETEVFFNNLINAFRQIFGDEKLELEFVREKFEFYIKLFDGRQITFDILPEGFSALLSILMDLFMRVDLIRKQVGDYSYNPCGIVLIDEPETHLHLQLQEQVLPLLISLFPNIQFIAATHSPAVIASIKNATIFDLTTKESRGSEETAGRSYSDLMMSHFGLENEYSGLADELIGKVDRAVAEFGHDPARLREELRPIYDANSAYLSPTLKVKFELLMAEQEAKAVTHS